MKELVKAGELTADTDHLELNGYLDAAHGALPIRGEGMVSVLPGHAR